MQVCLQLHLQYPVDVDFGRVLQSAQGGMTAKGDDNGHKLKPWRVKCLLDVMIYPLASPQA